MVQPINFENEAARSVIDAGFYAAAGALVSTATAINPVASIISGVSYYAGRRLSESAINWIVNKANLNVNPTVLKVSSVIATFLIGGTLLATVGIPMTLTNTFLTVLLTGGLMYFSGDQSATDLGKNFFLPSFSTQRQN